MVTNYQCFKKSSYHWNVSNYLSDGSIRLLQPEDEGTIILQNICINLQVNKHISKNWENSNLQNERHLQNSAGRFCYTKWKKVNAVCCFKLLLPFFIRKWLLTGRSHKHDRRGRSCLTWHKMYHLQYYQQNFYFMYSQQFMLLRQHVLTKLGHLQALLIKQGENMQLHSIHGINEISVLHSNSYIIHTLINCQKNVTFSPMVR